jgi:hypothetical protein
MISQAYDSNSHSVSRVMPGRLPARLPGQPLSASRAFHDSQACWWPSGARRVGFAAGHPSLSRPARKIAGRGLRGAARGL